MIHRIDPDVFDTESLNLGDGWSLTRLRLMKRMPLDYTWSEWFIQHGEHDCTRTTCVGCGLEVPACTRGLMHMLNGLA